LESILLLILGYSNYLVADDLFPIVIFWHIFSPEKNPY